MSHVKGFFKKFTGNTVSYDALTKQPIIDAENKLNIFKDVTNISISGLESYHKNMTKQFDIQLSEKFNECKSLFDKYESKGELLNANISHVLGYVFGRLYELQNSFHNELMEMCYNIDLNIIKPLIEYQKEITTVRDNRKDLKEAYDKIDQCRQNLDKVKREMNDRSNTASRLIGGTDSSKRSNEIGRLEEKLQRFEKELDEATCSANEKYDKYTESLFKKTSEECDLTNYYLEYLKLQRKYHKNALKQLDHLIPNVQEKLNNYNKKPVFGCSLNEYVNNNNNTSSSHQYVSPVIRRLIENMCKQNVFQEEGIFRVAGSKIKANCLIYAINAGYLDYVDLNDFDVHCLAGVLKQYIRELPDSILCNQLYDDWIGAINAQTPKKIDAFKSVLQKLPKANYENLRYLIKFLSRIVENSEKTKMTTTNMGICFGVNFISSNKAISSSQSASNLVLSSASASQISSIQPGYENMSPNGKSIDMGTATNVFDFMLTNHIELFPGDINFNTSGSTSLTNKQSFIQTSNKPSRFNSGDLLNPSHKIPSNANNFNTSLNESVHLSQHQQQSYNSNRHSMMVNDSFNSLNDTQSQNSPYNNKQSTINHNDSFSSAVLSPLNTSSNITNINRHIKNNSIDIKFIDQNNETISTNSTNHPSNSNNYNNSINKIFPPLQSQINSNSTVSLDSGSSSPKLKGKRPAPAPPKSNEQPISHLMSPITTVSEEPSQSTMSTSSSQSINKPLSNNSETSLSSVNSINSSNNLMSKFTNTRTSINETANSSSPLPTRTTSFRTIESNNSTSIIEKPNQPPPQVPVRTHSHLHNSSKDQQQNPPPIGFNVSILPTDTLNDFPPYPTVPQFPKLDVVKVKENGTQPQMTSSISSTNSSNSSLLQDQIISPTNTISKPIKPAIPRKPGNMISAHLNKFERMSDIDHSENFDEDDQSASKNQSEVTSL